MFVFNDEEIDDEDTGDDDLQELIRNRKKV